MIHEQVETGAGATTTWRSSCAPTATPTRSSARSTCAAIPWTFSGNAGLYGRPEVRLLIAFLRAVAHPDESVSVHYLASSDIYSVPIVDLTRCATWADRKHRAALRRAAPGRRTCRSCATSSARKGGCVDPRSFVADLDALHGAARARCRRASCSTSSSSTPGWLGPDVEGATSARDEAEVQNISKFFRPHPGRRQGAALRQRARVREAPRRADRRRRRSRPWPRPTSRRRPCACSPCTRRRGSSSPWSSWSTSCRTSSRRARREDALEVPARAASRTRCPPADFHMQEERRLFYVGMTRARRELYLTSARDYGGSRERKVSQFVLEALDLPEGRRAAVQGARGGGDRAVRAAGGRRATLEPRADRARRGARRSATSRSTTTRPARSSTATSTCCACRILRHHALVYGDTIHEVVEYYLRRRAAGQLHVARRPARRVRARVGEPGLPRPGSTRRRARRPAARR